MSESGELREPTPQERWMNSTSPREMYDIMQQENVVPTSTRKIRLFGCACYWPAVLKIVSQEKRKSKILDALRIFEAFADGQDVTKSLTKADTYIDNLSERYHVSGRTIESEFYSTQIGMGFLIDERNPVTLDEFIETALPRISQFDQRADRQNMQPE